MRHMFDKISLSLLASGSCLLAFSFRQTRQLPFVGPESRPRLFASQSESGFAGS
jgi:hypothetical protein